MSREKLEGMDTAWSWEAQETTEAEFSYDITLYSGKLKVVLIVPSSLHNHRGWRQEEILAAFWRTYGKRNILAV